MSWTTVVIIVALWDAVFVVVAARVWGWRRTFAFFAETADLLTWRSLLSRWRS